MVGKADELEELPYPVVDDGAAGRAPVHGVVAGMRRARHDVVVALPVDVPLVAGALRARGDARAVPDAGIPLPGAYPGSCWPCSSGAVASSLPAGPTRSLSAPPKNCWRTSTCRSSSRSWASGHALVVGATGMLAGLTRKLAARGHTVTSVARRPAGLGPGVTSVPLDYRDDEALSAGLARAVEARGPLELAVWIHTDAPAAPQLVATALAPGRGSCRCSARESGRSRTSRCTSPTAGALLGSTEGRWLTDDEISAGVLEAVDADQPTWVVGERGDGAAD